MLSTLLPVQSNGARQDLTLPFHQSAKAACAPDVGACTDWNLWGCFFDKAVVEGITLPALDTSFRFGSASEKENVPPSSSSKRPMPKEKDSTSTHMKTPSLPPKIPRGSSGRNESGGGYNKRSITSISPGDALLQGQSNNKETPLVKVARRKPSMHSPSALAMASLEHGDDNEISVSTPVEHVVLPPMDWSTYAREPREKKFLQIHMPAVVRVEESTVVHPLPVTAPSHKELCNKLNSLCEEWMYTQRVNTRAAVEAKSQIPHSMRVAQARLRLSFSEDVLRSVRHWFPPSASGNGAVPVPVSDNINTSTSTTSSEGRCNGCGVNEVVDRFRHAVDDLLAHQSLEIGSGSGGSECGSESIFKGMYESAFQLEVRARDLINPNPNSNPNPLTLSCQ